MYKNNYDNKWFQGSNMTKCYCCDLIHDKSVNNIVEENNLAICFADGYYREGHCSVVLKRHVVSISELTIDEYSQVFSLIKNVSSALEERFNAEKTYLLAIGDQVNHFHIHLIPKHKDKCSMGKYCFGALFDAEGQRKPTVEEQKKLRDEIVEIMTSKRTK